MTPVQKLAGLVVLVLMAGAAGFIWQVQEWRMGKRLAEQAGLHQGELADVSAAAAMQVSCNMPTAYCLLPPAPAAWFMAPQEPNLTQRMLNELSLSPMMVITD